MEIDEGKFIILDRKEFARRVHKRRKPVAKPKLVTTTNWSQKPIVQKVEILKPLLGAVLTKPPLQTKENSDINIMKLAALLKKTYAKV